MKRTKTIVIACIVLPISVFLLCACGSRSEKPEVRVLIVPKFEIGEINGDFPGEAQHFYENYCADCEKLDIPNATPTSQFYFNEENGVGLLVTGSGKTAAGLSLSALLSWDAYDFSDTWIVSVGCGGGSTGSTLHGDVVLVTAACDYDLGHHTDTSELESPKTKHTWFPDDSFRYYSSERMNAEVCETAYSMIKDCPLRTTKNTKRILAQNFPGEKWADRDPRVVKGTDVTSDNFWKGEVDHGNARYIAEYYKCPDAYAVTDMEEVAVMNTAKCFGMEDRVVSLRVIVNLDTFVDGESPERLWLEDSEFNKKVKEENSETEDIFEPGMKNLFDTGRIVIDAILQGELQR